MRFKSYLLGPLCTKPCLPLQFPLSPFLPSLFLLTLSYLQFSTNIRIFPITLSSCFSIHLYFPQPSNSEKAMASHSSTFAQKIPWMEEPGGLQSMGSLESDTTERLHFHFSLSCIREGNGNPLQCSFLENPRDGEAWWAAVYGVTESRT